MKRSTSLPLAALFLLATLFVACKGKDKVADDPKAVLTAFFERMANKDIEGATKLATKDSKGTMDMMKKAIDAAENIKGTLENSKTEQDDPVENFKSMEFGSAKIDGDKATVSVTNKKKNETFDFPLTKEGGSWKVDFSMSTLMKMGMNSMKNQGTDTEGTNLDPTENFNLDSLKEGLEKAEDVLKDLDPEKLKNLIEDNN